MRGIKQSVGVLRNEVKFGNGNRKLTKEKYKINWKGPAEIRSYTHRELMMVILRERISGRLLECRNVVEIGLGDHQKIVSSQW